MTRARHAPISGEKSPVCDGLPARLELLNNFKAKAQTLISLPQHTDTHTHTHLHTWKEMCPSQTHSLPATIAIAAPTPCMRGACVSRFAIYGGKWFANKFLTTPKRREPGLLMLLIIL